VSRCFVDRYQYFWGNCCLDLQDKRDIYADDGDSKFLRNLYTYLSGYNVQHPRRTHCSYLPSPGHGRVMLCSEGSLTVSALTWKQQGKPRKTTVRIDDNSMEPETSRIQVDLVETGFTSRTDLIFVRYSVTSRNSSVGIVTGYGMDGWG
jgi:hypothetical protein